MGKVFELRPRTVRRRNTTSSIKIKRGPALRPRTYWQSTYDDTDASPAPNPSNSVSINLALVRLVCAALTGIAVGIVCYFIFDNFPNSLIFRDPPYDYEFPYVEIGLISGIFCFISTSIFVWLTKKT